MDFPWFSNRIQPGRRRSRCARLKLQLGPCDSEDILELNGGYFGEIFLNITWMARHCLPWLLPQGKKHRGFVTCGDVIRAGPDMSCRWRCGLWRSILEHRPNKRRQQHTTTITGPCKSTVAWKPGFVGIGIIVVKSADDIPELWHLSIQWPWKTRPCASCAYQLESTWVPEVALQIWTVFQLKGNFIEDKHLKTVGGFGWKQGTKVLWELHSLEYVFFQKPLWSCSIHLHP